MKVYLTIKNKEPICVRLNLAVGGQWTETKVAFGFLFIIIINTYAIIINSFRAKKNEVYKNNDVLSKYSLKKVPLPYVYFFLLYFGNNNR